MREDEDSFETYQSENQNGGSIVRTKKWAVAILIPLFLAKSANAIFDPTGPTQVLYLSKILIENVRRFQQLQSVIGKADRDFNYFRAINEGLDNIYSLISVLPIEDQSILADLKDFQRALGKVEGLYGVVPSSQEASIQILHDQTVAESFKLMSHSREYANRQEKNADRVFQQSSKASPKGASRINAMTNAQILHTLNQILKVNGQLLKLQSEQLALTNKGKKDSVRHYKRVNGDIRGSFEKFEGDFKFPKF